MSDDWVEWAVVAAIVGLIAFIVVAAIAECMKPGFELKKDEWICKRQTITTTWQSMQVGNVTNLMPITQTRCDLWERK